MDNGSQKIIVGGTHVSTFSEGNSSEAGVARLNVTDAPVPVATTTKIVGSPNPSTPGQQVTFAVTVAAPTGTPQGNVAVFLGNTQLLTRALPLINGSTTFTFTTDDFPAGASLALGDNALRADFTPTDATAFGPSSGKFTQRVANPVPQATPTTTTITSSPNPSVAGQDVRFAVAVAPVAGSGVPQGSVTIYLGPTPLLTRDLTNGETGFTFDTSDFPAGMTLALGSNTLSAVFASNAPSLFTGSFGELTQRVAAPTTTTIAGDPNPAIAGQPVTFTVAVTATTGIPRGTVSVTRAGAASSFTGTLAADGTLTFTSAEYPAAVSAIGDNPLTAVFTAGDPAEFGPSTGTTTQTVNVSA